LQILPVTTPDALPHFISIVITIPSLFQLRFAHSLQTRAPQDQTTGFLIALQLPTDIEHLLLTALDRVGAAHCSCTLKSQSKLAPHPAVHRRWPA
jgi:hypothetical protein